MGLVALLPATSQAATTIVEPADSHFPYQRWIDESAVPTPETTIEVIEQPPGQGCPDLATEYVACTAPAEHKIWIAATQLIGFDPRDAFMHEVGHNFDADVMPEWARARFDSIYGFDGPWAASLEPQALPNEYFADSYADCADKPYLTHREMTADGNGPLYGEEPFFGLRSAYNKICRMIQGL